MLILTGFWSNSIDSKYRILDTEDYTEEWITQDELNQINKHRFIEFIDSHTHRCTTLFRYSYSYSDAKSNETFLYLYRIVYKDWYILAGNGYSSFYYRHHLISLSDKIFHCVYFYSPIHLVYYSETEQFFEHIYIKNPIEDSYIPNYVIDYYSVTQINQQTNNLIPRFTKYSTNLQYKKVKGIEDENGNVIYSDIFFDDKLCGQHVMCRMFFNHKNEWFVVKDGKNIKFASRNEGKEMGSILAPLLVNKIVPKVKNCIKKIKLTKDAKDLGVEDYTAMYQRLLLGYVLCSELKEERKFIWDRIPCMDIRFHVDTWVQTDTSNTEYRLYGSLVVEYLDEYCEQHNMIMRIPL